MKKVALGLYIEDQFRRPDACRCRNAEFVVFSGIKIDKLDDLQAIIEPRQGQDGRLGRLARHEPDEGQRDARRQGLQPRRDGRCRRTPTSPTTSSLPASSKPRSGRALGKKNGVEFVLPVDFTLGDGRVGREAATGRSAVRRRSEVERDVRREGRRVHRNQQATGRRGQPLVASTTASSACSKTRFENGTKNFMTQLSCMKDAGVEVYVGGGEGARPSRSTASPTGSPTASPPAAPCSTRSARSRSRIL